MKVKRTTRIKSPIETHYIETDAKYVHDYFYSNDSMKNDQKIVTFHVQEKEGDKYKTVDIPVKSYPDLVHITPLKYEYAVTFVFVAF